MVSSLNTTLFLLVLLTSCGGCKKESQTTAEPVIPATVASSCVVATQVIKELAKPNQVLIDPETVTINGESFQVSTIQKSAYTYDAQGRIQTEYNQYSNGSDSVYYQYTPTSVVINKIDLTAIPKTKSTQVVALNDQGLATKQPFGGYATYDSQGYLITLKNEYGAATVVDGNITKSFFVDSPATSSYIIRNDYDLNKPGLPSIQTFYGRPSRNLLTRSVIDEDNHFYIIPGVYTTVYEYSFNNKGQLIRQATRGKDGEHPFVYGGNLVKVLDFTYTCP